MAYQAQFKDPKPMRDLIRTAPEQEIEPVQADADANVSGAMPLAQEAHSELPDARTVKSDQTVQGQITDLLDSDNRYIQRAREQGKQFAAERGLINTSLAAQSGEAAAISAALPIASQDASTHAQAARQYQAHLEGLIQQANAGDVQAQLMLQEAGYNSQLSAAEHAQRVTEMAVQGDINARQQLEQAGYQSELSKQGASQQSELLSQEHQQSLVEMAKQGDIQAALQASQFSHEKIMEDIAQGHRLELSDKNFQQELDVMQAHLSNTKILNEQEAGLWRQNQQLVHQQTIDQINEQAGLTADRDQRLAAFDAAEQRARERFAGDQAALDRELRQIELQRNTQQNREAQAAALQSQYLGDVSRMHQQTSQNVTNIYSTEGLTAAQQQNAAASEWQRLDSMLDSVAAQYSGSEFWDPSWAQDVSYKSGTSHPGGPIKELP